MAYMWVEEALEGFANTLGVSYPDLILIISTLAFLITFAVDVRIGLMFSTVGYGVIFIFFTFVGLPVNHVLIVFMISLVLLTLSLLVKSRGIGAV